MAIVVLEFGDDLENETAIETDFVGVDEGIAEMAPKMGDTPEGVGCCTRGHFVFACWNYSVDEPAAGCCCLSFKKFEKHVS